MRIEFVESRIPREKLANIAAHQFGNLVKAVVDIEKKVMAIGGELHADEEALLIERGSSQENLWGINLYPANAGDDFVEFDSMVNIRPSQGNNSRSVEDSEIQKKVRVIVGQLVGQ